jgi:hypothetical protein
MKGVRRLGWGCKGKETVDSVERWVCVVGMSPEAGEGCKMGMSR